MQIRYVHLMVGIRISQIDFPFPTRNQGYFGG